MGGAWELSWPELCRGRERRALRLRMLLALGGPLAGIVVSVACSFLHLADDLLVRLRSSASSSGTLYDTVIDVRTELWTYIRARFAHRDARPGRRSSRPCWSVLQTGR